MNTEEENTPVEIFSGSSVEATMFHSFLEANGIQAFLLNNYMGTLEPWVVTAGGFSPVKVVVANTDYQKASKLLEDYNNSENEG